MSDDEVRAVIERWEEALSHHDAEALLACYATDATLESPVASHILGGPGICRGHQQLRPFPTGHVLLGALSSEELTAYLERCEPRARTSKTPVTPEEIRRRVDLAREERAALTDEELEFGLRSLAVPVVDSRGHTVAAMSVSATVERISMDQLRQEFLPVVREQAEQLGRKL